MLAFLGTPVAFVDHQLAWSVAVYHRDHPDVPLLARSYAFDEKLASGAYYNPSPARALVVRGLEATVSQAAADIAEAIAQDHAARAVASPEPAMPRPEAQPQLKPERPATPPAGDPFRTR